MKIQELAIIFVIIILPISILLSEYTQFQIQTIKTQTEYDSKLTTATYDAIKAFQLNAQNETFSGVANERVQGIERSVNSFRNSIMSSFKLNGYTEDELNNYIPALVYTLYDGLYIYSPYENTNYRYQYKIDPATGEIEKDRYTGEPIYETDASGNKIPAEGNGEKLYGLKPYISYSCRYIKGNIDVVITYALDNYITVQGIMDEDGDGSVEYVNKGGYLIDNINATAHGVWYNGIEIEAEQLKENVGGNAYQYVKRNGTKYYLVGNQIVSISNGEIIKQCSQGDSSYIEWVNLINNNTYAQQYYKDADEFTEWFKSTNLVNLTYNDAYDEVINEDTGETNIQQIWLNDNKTIFKDSEHNIENELSNFNQHRLAIIRHKIETNLAIAISNYNSYSNVENVFQLQQLKEDEWDQITHNISLISFLQGLPIGGKIYNGYTIVTNSESKEVVHEQDIYILGKDRNYHKIGDNNFEVDDSGVYGNKTSTGRLNIDFKRVSLTNSEGYQTLYYYPLKAYNASYNSIVMQNDVTTYDDIYEYVNTQNDDLKKAFYTALGRERYGMKPSVML